MNCNIAICTEQLNKAQEFDNAITKASLVRFSSFPDQALHREHVQKNLIAYCHVWQYPSEEQFKVLDALFNIDDESTRNYVLKNSRKKMKSIELQIIEETKKYRERMNILLKCIACEALKESVAEHKSHEIKERERKNVNVSFKQIDNVFVANMTD